MMSKKEDNELDLSKFNHYCENCDDTSNHSDDEKDGLNNIDKNTYNVIDSSIEISSTYDGDEPSDDDEEDGDNDNNGNFFTRNRCRNIKRIAIILVVSILLGWGGFIAYIYYTTSSDGYGDAGIQLVDEIDESDYLSDEVVDFDSTTTVDSDSLNSFLKEWYNNGCEKMYDKNVINVLLCGVENSDGTSSGVATAGRSDSMIIVSIDKKNKTIKMVSLYRDSWTYINVPKTDGSYVDYYFKLNSAYNYGGPSNLITTIENDYKIEIDQYIAVDFASFKKLIDAVGGIDIDVEEYEARYIRRTSQQTDFPYGENVHLNGTQALIYSRIRHCDNDGDISRTRRQRNVIKALIESAKDATDGQLVNAFKQVKDYMRTGYTQTQVLKLISQAVSHDWMKFTMSEMTLPNEDNFDCVGGYIGTQWAWAVDYPICAQKLQKFLYNKTNINLQSGRRTILDYVKGNTGSSSNSSSNSGSSNSGNSDNSGSDSTAYYQEPTTSSYDNNYEEETAFSLYDNDDEKDELDDGQDYTDGSDKTVNNSDDTFRDKFSDEPVENSNNDEE